MTIGYPIVAQRKLLRLLVVTLLAQRKLLRLLVVTLLAQLRIRFAHRDLTIASQMSLDEVLF